MRIRNLLFPYQNIGYQARAPFCLWDCFMSLLFLLTSGVVVWHNMLTPAVSMSFFLMCSFFTFYKRNGKITRSAYFFVISLSFVILNFLIYRPGFANNSVFGYIICLSATYLCLSTYNFYYFRKLITDWLTLICVLSIFVYLLEEFGVLHAVSTNVRGSEFQMIGPFVFGFGSVNHRFISIWHEAGAFQIILNTVLLLHIDSFKTWKWEKGRLWRMVMFMGCLALTQSTGGFLCIGIILCAVATDLKFDLTRKQKLLLIPIIFFVLLLAVAAVFTSDVVMKKLTAEEGDQEALSKYTRLYDALSCWQLSIERPILGWGLGSVDFYRYSERLGNTTSSSGFLKFAACMGWVWISALLFYVWNGSRRIYSKKGALCCLICYIAMMMNEDFIEFPIANTMIFYFASYRLPFEMRKQNLIRQIKKTVVRR